MYYIIMAMLILVGVIYGGFFLIFILAYGEAALSDRLRRTFDAKRTGDWRRKGEYAARRVVIHNYTINFFAISFMIWIPFFGVVAFLVFKQA